MNVIESLSLSKRYGGTDALRGVSFEVADSEIFGFIGPNGAGKTTTIRLIVGLLNATAGTVSVLGSDPRGSTSSLTEVGYIPGEFGLWPYMTGAECLEYLASLNPKPPARRDELCDLLELTRSDLHRLTRTYSRGMRQKIAIVQAFQHEPRLVVMDEPTEGLDPLMKERFINIVKAHKDGGGSALFSSHILTEVEECADRVAVIRKGMIVKVADTESLARQRLRHCVIKLKEPLRADVISQLLGVRQLRVEDRTARFDYLGDMQPLIQALATLPVLEFLSEPESLTEAFFEVYSQEPLP